MQPRRMPPRQTQPRRREDTKKEHPGFLWFLVGFVCLAVALPMAQQAAQPPQPTFRTAQTLVVQIVTVKDKDGKAVEGLAPKDFTLTEDGEPQTISFVEFQRVDAAAPLAASAAPGSPAVPPPAPPASTASAPPATAAEATAPRPPAAAPIVDATIAGSAPGDIKYRNRRLLVLYFDVTALPPADLLRACAAAETFLDTQMTAADLVAMMTFKGGAVRVKHDFTDNREELRAVLQDLIYGEDQDGDGIPDPEPAGAFGQDDAEFNIFNTDRQLSALQTAVAMLRPLSEQKSLIYFASGLRLNGTDNQAQLRATVNAALRANVAIHTIDARGLVAQTPLGDATRASPGGIGTFNGQLANAGITRFQQSQDSLYALAKDTGGQALTDYNDLSLGIVKAAESMSSYYLIGYYSTHTATDGRFRRVKVALNGGLSADLTYRQGYFADKDFAKFTTADKERQLEEALLLDNPVTDITLAMEVNYFQLNRAEYFIPVTIKLPGSELALARRGGAQRSLIDFIGEVKDDSGYTWQNLRDKLDIKFTDETAAQLATRPIQIEIGFTLLPGAYTIKLLARDAETGRMGTYQASFKIPNLEKETTRVPISSVVLSSQRVPLGDAVYSVQQKIATDAVNPLVFEGQKLMPSVTRVFSKSRDLYVFLQAYERGATATQPLVAFVAFYRAGVKAFETAPLAVSDGLDAKTKALPLRFSVPLGTVAPGRYDCQVTVLDPNDQKVAFWRAPVVVVP
jgi:VWFA-related protein